MDKKPQKLIDNRHLKILAAKREDMKGSIVFICLDEEKYGNLDKAGLRKISEIIDQIEPDGIYFPFTKKMDIKFYDIAQFTNKDVLVTVSHENPSDADTGDFEKSCKQALANAKSVRFLHKAAEITKV